MGRTISSLGYRFLGKILRGYIMENITIKKDKKLNYYNMDLELIYTEE